MSIEVGPVSGMLSSRCNACGERPAAVRISVAVAENARTVTGLCDPCAARLGALLRDGRPAWTVSPTDHLVRADGVPCRVWRGESPIGSPCFFLMHRVAVREGIESSEFDAALAALGAEPEISVVVEGPDELARYLHEQVDVDGVLRREGS